MWLDQQTSVPSYWTLQRTAIFKLSRELYKAPDYRGFGKNIKY
jgi:hypothetical protein